MIMSDYFLLTHVLKMIILHFCGNKCYTIISGHENNTQTIIKNSFNDSFLAQTEDHAIYQ